MIEAAQKRHWQKATIVGIERCTPRIKSFYFELTQPAVFIPGQHMDVRLMAPGGYEAQRSYSIASPPEQGARIELAIERLDDGEVSTFFHDVVRMGDQIELRGPIGGHFVWSVQDDGPLLLIGGGSGVVPLVSMIRHHALQGSAIPLTLVTSARTEADLLYLDELRALHAKRHGFSLVATVSRERSDHPDLAFGRIDRALLVRAVEALGSPRLVFVCGNNPFVETVTGLLLELDLAPHRIRTERYGG